MYILYKLEWFFDPRNPQISQILVPDDVYEINLVLKFGQIIFLYGLV